MQINLVLEKEREAAKKLLREGQREWVWVGWGWRGEQDNQTTTRVLMTPWLWSAVLRRCRLLQQGTGAP